MLGYDIAHSTLFSEEGFDRVTIRLPTDVILVKKGPTPKFADDSFNGEAGDSGSLRDDLEENEEPEEVANLGDLIQTAQMESYYQKSRGRGDDPTPAEDEDREGNDEEDDDEGKLVVELVREEVVVVEP